LLARVADLVNGADIGMVQRGPQLSPPV
jgi:hypothetical protein